MLGRVSAEEETLEVDIYVGSTIDVASSRTENCSAEYGGANASLDESHFNCSASASGGGINGHYGSDIELPYSQLSDCWASEFGGGIAAAPVARVSVRKRNGNREHAQLLGGAAIVGDDSTVEVVDSRIARCWSGRSGGGLSLQIGYRLSVTASEIVDCSSGSGTESMRMTDPSSRLWTRELKGARLTANKEMVVLFKRQKTLASP